MSNRAFKGYRSIGLIANHVPFAFQTRGTENYITTAVPSAFHIYDCSKLKLKFVGRTGQQISNIAAHGNVTITSSGSNISTWVRGRLVSEIKGHTSDVVAMLPFGEHLVTVGANDDVIVFNIVDGSKHV